MFSCPYCGEEVADGSPFCSSCGEKLYCGDFAEENSGYKEVETETAETSDKCFCSKCGNEIPYGQSVCMKCGCPVNGNAEKKSPVQKNISPIKAIVIIAVVSVVVILFAVYYSNAGERIAIKASEEYLSSSVQKLNNFGAGMKYSTPKLESQSGDLYFVSSTEQSMGMDVVLVVKVVNKLSGRYEILYNQLVGDASISETVSFLEKCYT